MRPFPQDQPTTEGPLGFPFTDSPGHRPSGGILKALPKDYAFRYRKALPIGFACLLRTRRQPQPIAPMARSASVPGSGTTSTVSEGPA